MHTATVTTEVRKTLPKRLLPKKCNFRIKQYFSPNRRNNLSPFRTKTPIRFHAPRALGVALGRNRKIMILLRTLISNRLSSVNINMQSKKLITNSLPLIQINFWFCQLFWSMICYSCAYFFRRLLCFFLSPFLGHALK